MCNIRCLQATSVMLSWPTEAVLLIHRTQFSILKMQIILFKLVWQQQASNRDGGQFDKTCVKYDFCCFRLAGTGGSWASGAWKRTCQSSRSQHMSQKIDGIGILLPSCKYCCHSNSCDGQTTEYDLSLSVSVDTHLRCRLTLCVCWKVSTTS